jgi:hypothetical protein
MIFSFERIDCLAKFDFVATRDDPDTGLESVKLDVTAESDQRQSIGNAVEKPPIGSGRVGGRPHDWNVTVTAESASAEFHCVDVLGQV